MKDSAIDLQEITKDLKAKMVSFSPGQRLVELELCKQYNAPRSKVREVLRQLERDGFVRIIPNVGAVVAELSQKDIEQTYDSLGVLEGLAARVATPAITADHLDYMQNILDKMKAAETPPQFFDYNLEFHSYCVSLCDNERLIWCAGNLLNHVRCFYYREVYLPYAQAASKEHQKILEAIRERKAAKVERLIRTHYLNAKHLLLKYMNKSL
jgi:DNA-binding GntR family transcriptional regulator